MKIEALGNLCIRDPRSIMHEAVCDDASAKPMEDCSCDNCFYGRSRMAAFILGEHANLDARFACIAAHMAEVMAITQGSKQNSLESVVQHCLEELKEIGRVG